MTSTIIATSTLLKPTEEKLSMDVFRQKISTIDAQLLDLLEERMNVARQIDAYKKENNIPIVQQEQWNKVLAKAVEKGATKDLSDGFIVQFLNTIHQESIRHQQTC